MYKEKILNLLRASGSAFLSGEELARRTGISRTMVWKHIRSLERDGFGIEAVPSQGYRIVTEPDLLRIADVRKGLRSGTIGREIALHPALPSTNTTAMELALHGAAEGTVVIAETQTAGKGRLGRTWVSPKGNLLLSVILRPDVPLHRAPLVTLMGAVAVAAAIREALDLPAGIKWPNDILLGGKKVCGLLTEMSAEQDRIRHIVLGIGVDVNMALDILPEEVRERTTTLAREAGRRVDRNALLRELLQQLDRWYRAFTTDSSAVLAEWERLNVTTGNRVTVTGGRGTLEGLAEGIDAEGRLLLRLDDGSSQAVSSGDVTIVKKESSQ